MGKPKVPSTISDKEMRELQRRAQKAQEGSIFSAKAVAQRKASDLQHKNAGKS